MDKHVLLEHRKVACECGAEFEPSLLALHKAEECRMRVVACRWCNLQVPQHQVRD